MGGFSFLWVDREIGVDKLVHKALDLASDLVDLIQAPHTDYPNTPRFSGKRGATESAYRLY